MSETSSPPAPPVPPSSPPPQTSNVFADRPCLKCGYNLRGQTATWNRRALNWQAAWPECGASQVGCSAPHRLAVGRPFALMIASMYVKPND